jgi:cytochrome b involved in lipid metabolism
VVPRSCHSGVDRGWIIEWKRGRCLCCYFRRLAMAAIPDVPNCPDKLFSWEEIRKHNKDTDCWVVVYGYVCDMTDFLPLHPGGLNPLWDQGGYDTTKAFEATQAHSRSNKAREAWSSRVIGRVDPNSKVPVVQRRQVVEKAPVRYSTWGPTLKILIPVIIGLLVLSYL